MDTPDTVHPKKPLEYFGKEASAFTKRMAEGETIRLEADPENTNRDRYNWLPRWNCCTDWLERGTVNRHW